MKYEQFRYIYPPRPQRYDPAMLGTLAGHVGQLKLNGTRTLVVIFPDRKIEFWTRHKTKHKAYSLDDAMKSSLLELNLPEGFIIFDGELLHNRSREYKNIIYFFDILVYGNLYLSEFTYAKRRKLLEVVTNPTRKNDLALEKNKNIWVAKDYKKLKFAFEKGRGNSIVEGLVVKNITSKLGYCFYSDKCNWAGKILQQ